MSERVFRQNVTVSEENGLHLVPCSRIAQLAGAFECDVFVQKGDHKVNAKTVLELMTLGAEKGTELVLEAEGNGANQAVADLVRLFESGFQVEDAES